MGYETLRTERRGDVALITISRPEALNAISNATSGELSRALDEADADPQVAVIVLTGVGTTAFCAGADLKEVAAGIPTLSGPGGFAGIVRRTLVKPVIAAVNGLALGGGAEIAFACDLIVAADTARFALPEVKRGVLASGGGLLRLPRQIPLKIAMELALTGEPITAQEAARWGLVNRVVPRARVVEEALELAATIARNAPLSVRATKVVITQGLDRPLEGAGSAWDVNEAADRAVLASDDAAEGPRAFVEKREPRWRGR